MTLPGLAGRREAAAALVSRFSTAAAAVLAALVLSGAFLAWRIVGSWDALLTDGYGQLLLVKIGVAALAVAIAAYNRFRLLPRMTAAAGFHDRVDAARALSRTTGRRGRGSGGGAAGDRVPGPEEPADRRPADGARRAAPRPSEPASATSRRWSPSPPPPPA